MPLFQYTGRAKDGQKLKGEMEARSTDDVARQLHQLMCFLFQ